MRIFDCDALAYDALNLETVCLPTDGAAANTSDGAGDVLDLRRLGPDVRVWYQQVNRTGSANDQTLVQVDVTKDGDVEAGEDFEVELSGLHDLGKDDNEQVVEVTDIVLV